MRIAAFFGGLCLLWAVTAGTILLPKNTITLPWILGSVLPCYCAGLFAWWHAPSNPVARRLLLTGTALSACIAIRYVSALLTDAYGWDLSAPERGMPSPAAALFVIPTEMDSLAVGVLVAQLLALLPDGRPRFRGERQLLGALWALTALPVLLPAAGVPTRVVELSVSYYPEAWLPGLGAALLVVRCLRARAAGEGRHRDRHQDIARLLPIASAAAVVFLGRGACRLFRTWTGETGVLYLIGSLLGALPYVTISLSVVYAAFRCRFLGDDVHSAVVTTALLDLVPHAARLTGYDPDGPLT
ncbi:hypothetical protein AB0K09_28955, partial [Streptomyces sp. NPDC049577]|uniref:hypothetical protein n=1 Tax=Streptomyces sp. NPDC049577 TaxID=3155153 RepID=UPI00344068D0